MMRSIQQPGGVLIATLGTEPQVVTATLDLLLERDEAINRVKVLHTQHDGAISSAVGKLETCFDDGYYPHTTLELFPLAFSSGKAVLDVVTPLSIRAAFRCLYSCVWKEKSLGSRIHLSLAGGRKPLSLHAMLTAQMLFDEEDCLWYLYSGGRFLQERRLHPMPGDEVFLLPIPILLQSAISPVLTSLRHIEDPYRAIEKLQALDLESKYRKAAGFVSQALTTAEERVVRLLVTEGLSDQQIGERLFLSNRTVEQHLRAAYRKAADTWEMETVNRTALAALLSFYYHAYSPKDGIGENPHDDLDGF